MTFFKCWTTTSIPGGSPQPRACSSSKEIFDVDIGKTEPAKEAYLRDVMFKGIINLPFVLEFFSLPYQSKVFGYKGGRCCSQTVHLIDLNATPNDAPLLHSSDSFSGNLWNISTIAADFSSSELIVTSLNLPSSFSRALEKNSTLSAASLMSSASMLSRFRRPISFSTGSTSGSK